MINYSNRLDKALRTAAWAHEQAKQHRKGNDIPYIIHPVGTMLIASNATDHEDTLIACLFHDILEDVDASIYGETRMRDEYGERVLAIVKDVTKNDDIADWHERSQAYLDHLQNKACDEAVIVSAADKLHNIQSMLIDFETEGNKLWLRFTTQNADDQVWWYESILAVITKRQAPSLLIDQLTSQIAELKHQLKNSAN